MEELALEIARTVHEDQNDADGRPHIEHVLRVAEGLEGDARLVAILHDVIEDDEDGRWTRNALVEAGFSQPVAGAVDVVSRRDGESYEAFIQRIVKSGDDLAVTLKLAELGYDIRKVGSASDPRGSHCGAGAPRFNVETADGSLYFIGCNSPPADTATVGDGWIRLRWGGSGPLDAYPASGGGPVDIQGMTVKSISIVFDEGQDTGPDFLGLAVLDNIDVNGRLVGTGGVSAGNR